MEAPLSPCMLAPVRILSTLLLQLHSHDPETDCFLDYKTNGIHTRLPTKSNALKLVHHMGAAAEGVAYLRGNMLYMRDDTDVELPFRQESHFFYLTGKCMKCVV